MLFYRPPLSGKAATMHRKMLGRRAEEVAIKFLRRKGFKIIERNFTCKLGEIDIVAGDGIEIVFVEVRSTSNYIFHDPATSITYSKIVRLRRLASVWLNYHKQQDSGVRFDAVLIVFNGKDTEIRHIMAAF